MEHVCNINHNIALILNSEEINIDRRRIYPGETWIDRIPTPPHSVFEFNKPSTKNDKNNKSIMNDSHISASFD